MLLIPRKREIKPTEGFTVENDIFGYSEFGERLTNMICGLSQPLTLVLDGPWGSGKSTFARQWEGYLRSQSVPVIYYDAFANDHSENPFISIAAEIIALGEDNLRDDEEDKSKLLAFTEMGAKIGRAALPVASRLLIQMLTSWLVNAESLQQMKGILTQSVDAVGQEIGDGLESAVKTKLGEAREEQETIVSFRIALSALAKQLSKKKTKSGDTTRRPLVFIIDELDRCRPSYALEVLEKIKHLFSVEDVVFVLVSNMNQLVAAVNGTYGSDIDAWKYLEKFHDIRAVLPIQRDNKRVHIDKYISFLWNEMEISYDYEEDKIIKESLCNLCVYYNANLRTIEKIFSDIILIYSSTKDEFTRINRIILVLCAMRHLSKDKYDKARSDELTLGDIQKFIAPIGSSFEINQYKIAWEFLLDKNSRSRNNNLPNEYNKFMYITQTRKDLKEISEILGWYVSMIEEFFIPRSML